MKTIGYVPVRRDRREASGEYLDLTNMKHADPNAIEWIARETDKRAGLVEGSEQSFIRVAKVLITEILEHADAEV